MPARQSIPLEGVLNCWNDEHDLPDLLLAMSRARKSGRLLFSNAEGDKTLYLKEGKIVFAESSSEDDGLGQYLLRIGKISLQDYTRVSKRAQAGKRLGALLVSEGVLDAKDLVPAVMGQVRAVILGLFRRTESWYGLKEEELSRKEAITLDMSVAQLVLDGVQYIESWRRVSKGVGDLDSIYRRAASAEAEWSRLKLEEGVRELLAMLKEPVSVAEICTRASLPDFDACRYLWAFRSLGWVERAETAEKAPAADLSTTVLDLEPPPVAPREMPLELVQTRLAIDRPPESRTAAAAPDPPPPSSPPEDLLHTKLFVEPPLRPAKEDVAVRSTGEMMEAILDGDSPGPPREPQSVPPVPPSIEEPLENEPSATRIFSGPAALEDQVTIQNYDALLEREMASGLDALALDYGAEFPPAPPPDPPPVPPGHEPVPLVEAAAESPAGEEVSYPVIEGDLVSPEPLPAEAPAGMELFALDDPFSAPDVAPAAARPESSEPLSFQEEPLAGSIRRPPRTEELDLDMDGLGQVLGGDDSR